MTPRSLPILAALLALVLTACGDDPERPAAAPSSTATPAAVRDAEQPSSEQPSSEQVATAEPVPEPDVGDCYRLTAAQAVAPTSEAAGVSCRKQHTSRTFAVGALDTVVDGHLLAVDSARVAAQVESACPRRFARFVGGDLQARRLSMLRPVWFTPTLAESDAGAAWFRCDVIALAAERRLVPLTGRLEGVLTRPEGRERYGVCGTAAPGAKDFARVICSEPHAWRAVRTVDLPDGSYPGAERARAAGQGPCEAVGRARAEDPLEFRWGYEWPTAQQWRQGRTYGVCWVPD